MLCEYLLFRITSQTIVNTVSKLSVVARTCSSWADVTKNGNKRSILLSTMERNQRYSLIAHFEKQLLCYWTKYRYDFQIKNTVGIDCYLVASSRIQCIQFLKTRTHLVWIVHFTSSITSWEKNIGKLFSSHCWDRCLYNQTWDSERSPKENSNLQSFQCYQHTANMISQMLRSFLSARWYSASFLS